MPREPWWSSGGTDLGAAAGDPSDGHAGEDTADDPWRSDDGQARHDVDVCGVCPICTGARLLGEVRPELVAHLAEAARHLAAAARTLMEDAERQQRSRSDPEDGLTRIDLD